MVSGTTTEFRDLLLGTQARHALTRFLHELGEIGGHVKHSTIARNAMWGNLDYSCSDTLALPPDLCADNEAAVDAEHRTMHKSRLIRGKPDVSLGDVLRFAHVAKRCV